MLRAAHKSGGQAAVTPVAMKPHVIPGLVAASLLIVSACVRPVTRASDTPAPANGAGSAGIPQVSLVSSAGLLQDIHKIQHVVVLTQENRSFDHYFGTYPGADGLPMVNGSPSACVPDPATHRCVAPYHDTSYSNTGGPHHADDATQDINGGKMDGFIQQQMKEQAVLCVTQATCDTPRVAPDVMGYHTAEEIPNYWSYAQNFVLQDHLFAPTASWSLPTHLFMISGWSARCSSKNPLSCKADSVNPDVQSPAGRADQPYSWTDVTYLLHKDGVSWGYYVPDGTQPLCATDAAGCSKEASQLGFAALVNPLARFQTVQDDGQLGNIQGLSRFLAAAHAGALPAVSWIVPDGVESEHPPYSIRDGQAFVTKVVNAVMQGPDWSSTAIFVTWDEWGGFYDHVVPPVMQGQQYGLRVPGLVISPYARQGYIDHQTLSFSSYLRFIEDDFLGGQRLDPQTDGRPDGRPAVREDAVGMGNLAQDFDFSQAPRQPLILPPMPPRSR